MLMPAYTDVSKLKHLHQVTIRYKKKEEKKKKSQFFCWGGVGGGVRLRNIITIFTLTHCSRENTKG